MDNLINLDDSDDYINNSVSNIYNSWSSCRNNHQIIENISSSKIIFNYESNSNYSINNNICDYDSEIHDKKRTLYIDKCNELEITVNNKFNHIILINSSNINITIAGGLITGIDILRSKGLRSSG